jgi:hypothetical protein
MVLGWDVSIWEGVLLDCIGHAVVRRENELLCVTPSKYPGERLLFLPDPSLTFDFEDPNARMPVAEFALSARPEVAHLIEAIQRERAIDVRYPVSSQPLVVQGQDAIDLQRLRRLKSELTPEGRSCHRRSQHALPVRERQEVSQMPSLGR